MLLKYLLLLLATSIVSTAVLLYGSKQNIRFAVLIGFLGIGVSVLTSFLLVFRVFVFVFKT